MPRLQLHAYVNVERRILTDSAGDPLGGDRLIEFFREEAGVICFHCFKDDGSVWPFGISDILEFGTARDWDPATAVDILSEADQFNLPGDWDLAGVSQIDPALGRICCRYNTNTTNFNGSFDALQEAIVAGLYLKQIDLANGNVTLCQYAATYRNIRRVNGETPPGVESPTYPTTVEVAASIAAAVSAHNADLAAHAALMAALAVSSPLDRIAATGLTAGKVYRWNESSSSLWVLADPDDAICETCELFYALSTTLLAAECIAVATIAGATQGKPGYLSDAGAIVATVPSSPTDNSRVGRIVAWVRPSGYIRFDGHASGDGFGS